MFEIDNYNNITLTAGDDATLAVHVFDKGNKEVAIKPSDTLVFVAKRTVDDTTAALEVTAVGNKFAFTHTATAGLSGTYSYQIQLTTNTKKYTVTQGYLYMEGDLIA